MAEDLFGTGAKTEAPAKAPTEDLFAPSTSTSTSTSPAIASPAASDPNAPTYARWRRGDLAPIERNLDTGEWRWAIPGVVYGVIDAITLPGEVMRGEVDPMGEQGFERTMNLATMAMGGRAIAGAGAKGRAPGSVVSETTDVVSTATPKTTTATATARLGNEIPILKEVPKQLSPTVLDQELDAFFLKGKATAKQGEILQPDFPPRVELKLKQAERLLNASREKELANYMTQLERAYGLEGKELKTGPVKTMLESSKNAVAALDDPAKVDEFVKGAEKATTGDRIFEVWVNSLLSGPQTHAVNTLSNSLVNLWGLAESGVAASISKMTGSGLTFKETGHRAMGDLEAVGDALRAAGTAFKTERELFEVGKLENRRQLTSIPGPIGRAVRIPGRLLTGEDAFFKTLAYRQEIDGLAVRNALNENLSGKALANRIVELKAKPTEAMMESAVEFAKKQTFTNGLGSIGKATQNVLRQHTGLRYIMPFFRTPVNLIKYSAERTPAGLAMKHVRDDIFGRNGAIKRDQALAKMTMGSSIGAWTFYQAAQGNVTGFGPSNQNERKLWLANGNQPYSIRIGDTWYSYSRLEPLGTILGIAGDLQTLSGEATEKELDDIASLIAGSISRNATSKTWLRGPTELAEVLSDPDRYGEQYIQRMLGTIVPIGVAQYSRVQDPFLREVQSITDGIKERVPGYRETLAVRHDVFGEPIKSEGGLGPDLVSPVYTKLAKTDPTINEMLRLEVTPGRLEKQIGGVDLTPEEWDFYSQVSGRTLKQYMDAVVNHSDFKELPDDLRREVLEDSMRKARDVARLAMKVKFPDLTLRMASKKHGANLTGGVVVPSEEGEAAPVAPPTSIAPQLSPAPLL